MDILKDFKDNAAKGLGYTEKALLSVAYDKMKKRFTRVLKVQFNPASLEFENEAGSYNQPNLGGAGENQINQKITPPKTSLSFDLIFDRVDVRDAFMTERVRNISAVSEVMEKVKPSEYSVRDEVEGMIGMMMSSETRLVQFSWGELYFTGEVTKLSATYTMFNPKGSPIRAKLSVTITQSSPKEAVVAGKKDLLDKQWEKSFDKIFKVGYGSFGSEKGTSDSSFDAGSKLSYVQNILNL